MVKLETSVSLASLGLIVMFVLLMYSFISIYNRTTITRSRYRSPTRRSPNPSCVDIGGSWNNTGRDYLWFSKILRFKENWNYPLYIRYCSDNW